MNHNNIMMNHFVKKLSLNHLSHIFGNVLDFSFADTPRVHTSEIFYKNQLHFRSAPEFHSVRPKII